VTEHARILKFEPAAPPAQKTPSGYAAIPREITRRTELPSGSHRVLTAIFGLCYGDDRHTRATRRMIVAASGLSIRTVRRHLVKLTRAGLIVRRPNPDAPGSPWCTFILCHPKEFVLTNDPKANWAVKRTTQSHCTDTPPRGSSWPPPGGQVGPPPGVKLTPPRLTDSQQTLNLGGKADLPPIVAAPPLDPPPSNPPPGWDSRQEEVVALATQRWGSSNGDCMIGDLLRAYPVELVKAAVDRHWDKVGPNIRPALLRATCQGMLADGWTPNQPSREGDGSVPYKRDGPTPPPVKPMTEEERAAFQAESRRLLDAYRARKKNGH